MKNRTTIGLLCAVLVLTPLAASAEIRAYLAISGGADFPADPQVATTNDVGLGNIETGTGFSLGVAPGVDFGNIRTELRLDIRRADIERTTGPAALVPSIPTGGRIGVLGILPEVNFDYPIFDDRIELHTGFGLGAAQLRDTTFSDWGFLYAFNLGVYWPVRKPFGVDLTYRYSSVPTGFETPGGGTEILWADHALVGSIRLYFDGWRD